MIAGRASERRGHARSYAMVDDVFIPTTVEELRRAISEVTDHRWALQGTKERVQQSIAPYEGMGPIANMPQLEPTRREVKELQHQVEQADRRIADLIKRLSEKMMEEDRTDREVRDFWFRRFMLSLQIGNGAAFLATVDGLFHADKEVLPLMAALAWPPATYFGLGVASAGLLPLLMAAQRAFPSHQLARRSAYIAVLALTTFSMGFFALGSGSVVVEIRQVGQLARHIAGKAPMAQPAASAKLVADPNTVTPPRQSEP